MLFISILDESLDGFLDGYCVYHYDLRPCLNVAFDLQDLLQGQLGLGFWCETFSFKQVQCRTQEKNNWQEWCRYSDSQCHDLTKGQGFFFFVSGLQRKPNLARNNFDTQRRIQCSNSCEIRINPCCFGVIFWVVRNATDGFTIDPNGWSCVASLDDPREVLTVRRHVRFDDKLMELGGRRDLKMDRRGGISIVTRLVWKLWSRISSHLKTFPKRNIVMKNSKNLRTRDFEIYGISEKNVLRECLCHERSNSVSWRSSWCFRSHRESLEFLCLQGRFGRVS